MPKRNYVVKKTDPSDGQMDAQDIGRSMVPHSAMSVEEMELEARRLYIATGLKEQRKEIACSVLLNQLPLLKPARIMEMMTSWDRRTASIEKKSDAEWGRKQLIHLWERSQLRASQYDNALGHAIGSEDQIRALDAARREDSYQITLVDRIVGLKGEIEENAEEEANAKERPRHIEELVELARGLMPSGEMQEKISVMRKAAYGE